MRISVRRILVYLVNVVIAFSFGIGVNIWFNYGTPFIRGFYCNDESINHPYHDSTVPSLDGVIVVFASIIVVVACGEILEKIIVRGADGETGIHPNFNWHRGDVWKQIVFDSVCLILVGVYGAGITMFITDVGKYTVGRLRPHFLDVCKPDWSRINCTNSRGQYNYIVGDQFCTTATDNSRKLKEARLSFPSGHSSFSMFGATYIVLYMQHRILTDKWASLGKLFIQIIPVCGAFYTGCSRVSDYKHHAGDVVAGFAIGVLVALVLYVVVLRRFYTPQGKQPCQTLTGSMVPYNQESDLENNGAGTVTTENVGT